MPTATTTLDTLKQEIKAFEIIDDTTYYEILSKADALVEVIESDSADLYLYADVLHAALAVFTALSNNNGCLFANETARARYDLNTYIKTRQQDLSNAGDGQTKVTQALQQFHTKVCRATNIAITKKKAEVVETRKSLVKYFAAGILIITIGFTICFFVGVPLVAALISAAIAVGVHAGIVLPLIAQINARDEKNNSNCSDDFEHARYHALRQKEEQHQTSNFTIHHGLSGSSNNPSDGVRNRGEAFHKVDQLPSKKLEQSQSLENFSIFEKTPDVAELPRSKSFSACS